MVIVTVPPEILIEKSAERRPSKDLTFTPVKVLLPIFILFILSPEVLSIILICELSVTLVPNFWLNELSERVVVYEADFRFLCSLIS